MIITAPSTKLKNLSIPSLRKATGPILASDATKMRTPAKILNMLRFFTDILPDFFMLMKLNTRAATAASKAKNETTNEASFYLTDILLMHTLPPLDFSLQKTDLHSLIYQ